ncbi:hypothetical protein [Leptospira harrisiae]|uniref:hypothetical protein n=1 Tax=Leptospira harrisiae TaxID=2023189 RepID=UPI0013FD9B14|nr:hypothetical protein [Leptospira harrisiae]
MVYDEVGFAGERKGGYFGVGFSLVSELLVKAGYLGKALSNECQSPWKLVFFC